MRGALLLESGHLFAGTLFGYQVSSVVAEVVFNTGMVGYQEVMTDPSYKGQMVVMTYPLMGNYGLNAEDNEATRPSVSGFIVKEACSRPANFRLEEPLDAYLKHWQIPGISGVDTRRLTRILRESGTMKGMITSLEGRETIEDYAGILKDTPVPEDSVRQVTTPQPYTIAGAGKRVVVIDLGIKKSILDHLKALGLELVVVPSHSKPKEILALNPDGLFLSNGPGDPKEVQETIDAIQAIIEQRRSLPIFGICLGHQLLALALGGDTYKLKFGHRGINHPVKDLFQNRVHITSQNHGYAVRAESLPPEVTVTHLNLNDGTVEGFIHQTLPIMTVQYHPEAAPGPEDSRYLFQQFYEKLQQSVVN